MTKHATQLTLAVVATALAVVWSRREALLLLPVHVAVVVVPVGASTHRVASGVTLPIVVVGDRIRRDRSLRCHNSRLEFNLMVKETFMDFSESRRHIATFNLIDDHFVFLRKTFNHKLNLIFKIQRFTKQSNLIKTSSKSKEIIIDRLSFFLPVFKLLAQLLEVGSARLRVGRDRVVQISFAVCATERRGWRDVEIAPRSAE